MQVLFFVKNFFTSLKDQLGRIYRIAGVQAANPTCNIHYTSRLNTTKLGKYNVIFPHVTINNSSLGSHTYVQKGTVITAAQIGKFCSIAAGVTIGPGIHNLNGVSTHPAFYLKNTPLAITFSSTDKFVSSGSVTIGHDVWIGQNAVVLDGVTIGTGAIVAAGAIVVKDVAPYSIVGGVPAKVIRQRFDNHTCEQLLNSAWWDLPEEYLQQHHHLFEDPAVFLSQYNQFKV